MTNWMTWLVLAGILVILEIFSGTFYLLMIASAWLRAHCLHGLCRDTVQVILAAAVALAATYLLRKSKYGRIQRNDDAARDPNVNMDIGQILSIDEWKNEQGEQFVARVMYRGAKWDVELEEHADRDPVCSKSVRFEAAASSS